MWKWQTTVRTVEASVGLGRAQKGPNVDAADVYLARPSDDDIERQLKRNINAVVGTLNPDGTIHLAFVLFLWQDGKFYFETSSMTKKARNVAASPTASFAIDPPGFMAMAEGVARIIDGDEAHRINRTLREKYLVEAARGVGDAWESIDDIAIEITPHKWRSWSSEALVALSAEGADGLSPDEWWIPEDGS